MPNSNDPADLDLSDQPTIIHTTTLLYRKSGGPSPYFGPDEKDDENFRGHYLTIDPEVWVDLGKPDVLTVTIEPGDLLNQPNS